MLRQYAACLQLVENAVVERMTGARTERRRSGEPRWRIRLRAPSLQLLRRGDELRDGQVCCTDERPQGPLGDLVVIRYG